MELASENHLGGIPALAAIFGIGPLQLVQLDDPSQGWKAILEGNVRSPLGRAGSDRSIYCRVCGECFATDEKPYHRSEWDLPLSLVCRIHLTLLLDACATCRQPIDYLRKEVTRCSCGASFPPSGAAPPPWVSTMVKFFVDPDDMSRRGRFSSASADEMQAGRALMRIAEHQAGRSTLYASGKRVGISMVRQAHLEDLRPWFEDGADSFLARMKELGGEEEGWMRYRISLKLYRFPRLSGVLSTAIKVKPLRVRRAARGDGGEIEMFYRADDLRRAFRMNLGTIVYWASVGILPSDAFPPGQRSRISVAAFEKVKKLFEGSCSQKEAVDQLGCSKEVVRKLIRLGALKRANLLPTIAHDRVDLKSMRGLNAHFLSRTMPGPAQGPSVSFEEVVKAISSAEAWKSFQADIEAGAGVYWVGEGRARLVDLRFCREGTLKSFAAIRKIAAKLLPSSSPVRRTNVARLALRLLSSMHS